jgi:hypothetical protein
VIGSTRRQPRQTVGRDSPGRGVSELPQEASDCLRISSTSIAYIAQ